jgi:hypothetical protein
LEDKIPFYNIVNMFLIGFVFVGFLMLIFMKEAYPQILKINISINNVVFQTILTVIFFAMIYEIGFILNRISSIIIEGILRHLKLVPYNKDYKKFNDRKRDYPIMEVLSREYALSRTSLTVFSILTIISIIKLNWKLTVIFLLVSLLFFFSTKKHASKIVELMT